MEYASKAVGTAGLSLGIIGTSLGALAGAGGLAGWLGCWAFAPVRVATPATGP